jgi:hypothetical protein
MAFANSEGSSLSHRGKIKALIEMRGDDLEPSPRLPMKNWQIIAKNLETEGILARSDLSY